MADTMIPVVLFAYNRPQHLSRTLESLKNNQVPLLYIYSDAPKMDAHENPVLQVRKMIHEIDWCMVKIVERDTNYGLGKSILTGVTNVLEQHEMAIIFEDDLICVPGTYQYLCAALQHYKEDPRVMSVTGWTHPSIIPKDITDQPYFDGRAECWVWGTWARVWQDITEDAISLTKKCKEQGMDIYQYGADLPEMAKAEKQKNIWAVRFLYWHILNRGLCLRPPWSLVEHIGFDQEATNIVDGSFWANPPLRPSPVIPAEWPEPVEHPACTQIWRQVCGTQFTTLRKTVYSYLLQSIPSSWRGFLRRNIVGEQG